MKKHLFIITALCLSATSCRSTKEVSHRADTVYIAQRLYDSVFVDRQCTVTSVHDTVFIDRLKTEYRYRLRTDTLYLYHTDTVVKTTHKDVSAKSYNMRPWVIVGVVVMGVIIRKQIMKNSSRG